VLPLNFRDVTAERIGTIIGIVGPEHALALRADLGRRRRLAAAGRPSRYGIAATDCVRAASVRF
jgi:hypothetical protein